jgi:hypothetical protein
MNESRRDFIKQAGKAAAGMAMLGSLDACSAESFKDHAEYSFESLSAREAHLSGNEFEKRVGDTIKEQYPCRVENPSVRIVVTEDPGGDKFKFIWHCNFVKSKKEEADYYFSRRGTLLPGATAQIAYDNVEAELKQSGKVQSMIDSFDKKYGDHRMPVSFVSESFSPNIKGQVWCIREFFCTAKKKETEV